MEPNAVYSDINVSIDTLRLDSEAAHKPLSKVYACEPTIVPLNKRATISISYPDVGCDPQRLGLYELIGERDWRFVGEQLDTLNKAVSGEVRYLSAYAVLEDTLPPTITRLSLRAGSRIRSRKPRVTALVKDGLSGIQDDREIEVKIDGKWMIPEYDVEKSVLSITPLHPLVAGRHLLTIRARDRAGNEARVDREFFVVGE
jgi:hypothetical protein